jgi:hypothetical protein
VVVLSELLVRASVPEKMPACGGVNVTATWQRAPGGMATSVTQLSIEAACIAKPVPAMVMLERVSDSLPPL